MITEYQYKMLEAAYNFFNRYLFDGQLSPVFISFQKSRGGVRGTYCKITYKRKETENEIIPEIELNPTNFRDKKDEVILSTLVHEMCHHWQHCFGTPSPKYHNKEWADFMEKVGLMPSSTGKEGGKRVGATMTHYIIPGGRFEYHCREFLRKNGKAILVETSSEYELSKALVASRESKTKYTCPACGQNAWAKPDASLICGFDNTEMTAKK